MALLLISYWPGHNGVRYAVPAYPGMQAPSGK